ncbi:MULTISPECIES: ribosome maturation factor RimM [Clostridium]|jgi:16S rRNA processing protein RimM|uniref:ribosome maturation factor RimM n=1 Tax=Clostridium TaxID=1485 RepID=UPI0002892622|nr:MULTISPECIES: ribosome maturation factor RimM [Clostridium]MDF2502773.1 rRNA processing protein RimM [Clostridium sp.]
MKEFLTVGQIINTHGVKGEVKVYPLTDNTNRFRKLKKVYIDGIEKNISWCKIQPDKIIMKIEGIETPEIAMKYKNKYLQVNRENAVSLDEGRYFVADIIGCRVIDEDNNDIGTVFDVIVTGSNDVYWVKGNEEVLVPALKSVVVKMDMDNKLIVIKPVKTWS